MVEDRLMDRVMVPSPVPDNKAGRKPILFCPGVTGGMGWLSRVPPSGPGRPGFGVASAPGRYLKGLGSAGGFAAGVGRAGTVKT
jgi:hypothetical protein